MCIPVPRDCVQGSEQNHVHPGREGPNKIMCIPVSRNVGGALEMMLILTQKTTTPPRNLSQAKRFKLSSCMQSRGYQNDRDIGWGEYLS